MLSFRHAYIAIPNTMQSSQRSFDAWYAFLHTSRADIDVAARVGHTVDEHAQNREQDKASVTVVEREKGRGTPAGR